jgi:hypothetical protein
MDNNELSEDLFFEIKDRVLECVNIDDQKEILNNLIYLLNEYKK